MASSLPQPLTATAYKNVEKAKNAPKTNLGKDLDSLSTKNDGIDWGLLDHAKVTSAADVGKRIADIQSQMKNVAALKTQAKVVETSADDFTKKAGKDFDKTAMNAVAAMKKEASGYAAEAQKKFDAALKELQEKAKNAPKAAGKQAAPAPTVSKADEALLIKFSRKALAQAMKPKPGVKPPMFSIMGKKGAPVKVLMGSKSEVTKLQGKFHKKNANGQKPPLKKDPQSQILFENGFFVFVSTKIDKGFLSSVKKALKLQTKKSPKLKWRKPGTPDVEAEGASDEIKAEEMQDAEEKATPQEQQAAQREYTAMLQRVKTAMGPALKTKSPADAAEINDTMKEAEAAAGKTDFVEALGLLEAIEGMLEDAPEDDSEAEAGEMEEEEGASTPAAKSAAPAAAPAAPAAAPGAPAAKSAAPAAGDLAQLRTALKASVASTLKGLDVVTLGLAKMFPDGQRPPNWKEANDKLTACKEELQKLQIDGALAAVEAAKTPQERAQKIADVRKSVAAATSVVNSDVMKSLDAHGLPNLPNLTVAADLRKTLTSIATLR